MVAAAAEAVVAPDLADVEADLRAGRRGCRGSARCCAPGESFSPPRLRMSRRQLVMPLPARPFGKDAHMRVVAHAVRAAAVADDVVVQIGDDVPALRLGVGRDHLAAVAAPAPRPTAPHRRWCRGICASTAPAPPRARPRFPSRRRWRPARRTVAFSGSVTRLSIWPVMITTSLGRSVPRWIATMSHTRVGVGMRSPVNVSHGRSVGRPSAAELALRPVERRADPALGVGLRRQRMARAEARRASRPSPSSAPPLTGAMIALSLASGDGGGAAPISARQDKAASRRIGTLPRLATGICADAGLGEPRSQISLNQDFLHVA